MKGVQSMNKHKSKSGGLLSPEILLILGIILPVILVFSLQISLSAGFSLSSVDDLKISDYFKSATFSSDLYPEAESLLNGISARETLDSLDSTSCVDLEEIYNGRSLSWPFTANLRYVPEEEIYNGRSLSYKNTSGLAYSFDDLLKWSRYDDLSGGDDWIVLNLDTDNGRQYMYYSDFASAIQSGDLKLNATGGSLKKAGISQKQWEENILYALKYQYAYADSGIKNQEPLKNITDRNGNVLYTNIYNCSEIPSLKMHYAPEGYGSLLEYMNSTSRSDRGFTGSLSDAYDCLSQAIQEVKNLSSRAAELDNYTDGASNISYCYINNKTGNIYSNSGNDYKKISDSHPYISLFPDISKCSTNLNTEDVIPLSTWNSMVTEHTGDSDFTFYMWIADKSLPAGDRLQASSGNYRIYRKTFIPAVCLCILSVLLFLFVLIKLTVKAGHSRSSTEKSIHLNAFDKIYTEIAAAIVCIPALILLWILLSFSTESMLSPLIILGITVFLISCLFWIGYLSLVRRIKAGTLWKNSLLHRILKGIYLCLKKSRKLMEFYSRNTISRVRMTLALAGFIAIQFLACMFWTISMVNQSSITAFVLFLILFAVDLKAFLRMYHTARGREILLDGLKKITNGDLSYKIPADTLRGDQKNMAEYINRIGDGLDAAVDKNLRDERMKTELITNVSHDLKTPLTSIINYIDLLKRKNFTDPEVLNYLQILDSKSQRLKSLTEDVVEASKASTGNISLEMADLDFVEMLYQVMGEFEERMEKAQLTLMTHMPDSPAMICADGRRMWRVLENLFGNVLKYAMENTRVYAEVLVRNDTVIFTLKNISKQPLNIPAEELTERFIRGDVARNTEGSGLGLSIAQSLTQLQGGTFTLYLDGDLFKVCLKFPRKK